MNERCFLGLHLGKFEISNLGAGYHDLKLHTEYRNLATAAYNQDSQLTNAGFGSNLNILGSVECDASIMDGSNKLWGAVGALKGIKNPISVAHSILKNQSCGNENSLIFPCLMVSSEATFYAKTWAKAESSILESDNSYREYKYNIGGFNKDFKKWTGCDDVSLENLTNPTQVNSVHPTIESSNIMKNVGTVGAVCIDINGNFYASISSGGSMLKPPGRLGQAAMYGCGCWAQNINDTFQRVSRCPILNINKNDILYEGVALTTSGCGEQLIRTMMAKTLAENLLASNDACQSFIQSFEYFLDEGKLFREPSRNLGGAIAILSFKEDTPASPSHDVNETNSGHETSPVKKKRGSKKARYEFIWGHTCRTMCVAYGTCSTSSKSKNDSQKIPKPNIHFSIQPEENCGKSVFCQGVVI